MSAGSSTSCRELARSVHQRHSDQPAASGDVPGNAGNLEDNRGGNLGGRGETPALHECRVDGGRGKRLESQVGVPLMGPCSQEANRRHRPADLARRGSPIGGSADEACPSRGGVEKLQDNSAADGAGSVQGRGSSIHCVHRTERGIKRHMLQCSAPERLGHHEADWSADSPRTGPGAAADQAAEAVLHGHHVLRVDEEADTVGRRCLGRHAAAAREVAQLSTRADLILPQARLHNRTNLCHCNALLQCVYWLGEVSTMAKACYGSLQAGLRVLRTAGELTLPNCMMLQPLFRGWPNLHQQHDAGEFLQRVLAVAQPGACAGGWEARLTDPASVHDSGDLGIPLFLHLPGETLQALVDSWHAQFATHALTYHGGCLFLQICRYSAGANKNMQYTVAMPVFTDHGNACTRLEQFRVVAAVFHQGQQTTNGHYQALLGRLEAGRWISYVCNDNSKPRRANARDLAIVDRNAYLVGLLRSP